MDRKFCLASVAGAVIVASVAGGRRYRGDVAAAYARLDAVDRTGISTDVGVIEYAELGTGPPLLVSHGIFHGCDGGLLAVRDVIEGRRVIAPSRFGYLGSTLPPNANSANQADAFVSLLNHLGLERVDVICISAGTSAALQLAIRHSDRVGHLVISSGNLPGSPTATAPPGWARVFYNDAAMWMLKSVSPALINRLMGVPDGFPQSADQADVDHSRQGRSAGQLRRRGASCRAHSQCDVGWSGLGWPLGPGPSQQGPFQDRGLSRGAGQEPLRCLTTNSSCPHTRASGDATRRRRVATPRQ